MSATPLDIGLIQQIQAVLPGDIPVYLVGGAVRDLLLGRPVHDLDFAVASDALGLARQVARGLRAAYYPLDELRDTGRVVWKQAQGRSQILDFAVFRGPTLESDLCARDFTLNAIALDLRNLQELIDPLGGGADLQQRILRACSRTAVSDDPVRILRAVRQAVDLNLHIEAETHSWIRQAVHLLPAVSAERLRDELFRMLDGNRPALALRLLEVLGVLQHLLPELPALKGQHLPAVQSQNAWEHTLSVVQNLAAIWSALSREPNPDAAANWRMGLVSLRLGRYRPQLDAHLVNTLNPLRSVRALVCLAACYHALAEIKTGPVAAHPAEVTSRRGSDLRLSRDEIERWMTIHRHFVRLAALIRGEEPLSRRLIYRFFREAGPAGVDISCLSLADTLATYGAGLADTAWIKQMDRVRLLLQAWWEQPDEMIRPAALLDGRELMATLQIMPGPQVGTLLEAIREAQAAGDICDRAQALALARQLSGHQGAASR